MDKKRVLGVFGLTLSVFAFLISLVSAYGFYYGGLSGIFDSVVNTWEPILQALLGGFGWSGMFLFERLLLFVVLISIVYIAAGRIPLFEEQRAVRWIIAIIVPLIGIRYINYEWLSSIILQYQVLAIVLVAILPFALFVFFLYDMVRWSSSTLRRLGWGLFIAIYFGLWSTSDLASNATIYVWTMIAAIVCFIFDKKISGFFIRNEGQKAEENIKADMAIEAWKKYQDASDMLARNPNNKLAERQVKVYQAFLKKHGLI